MKRTIKVEGFIYNEKKDEILAVRKRDLTWGFPGGRVDQDETMEEALIRKVKQQTSIEVAVSSLLYCKERRTAWEHVCIFVFRAKPVGGFTLPQNDESVFRVKWLGVPLADDLLPEETASLHFLLNAAGAEYEHCNEFPAK
ncbi:MutT/nudix family protein [Listeria floridensis FSL S10-1187]|uniref:MutT/nudix family protein n=1 Tax=Listeria floridensis FSL S10-1187 TaxID=1265817 RepID=A0ABN0RFR6_9LIST|nr:NUDIX hydrolase [Listeria floridensis]EUJ32399.1 MutT/nudix family protein [Listeria floridensis FSL S10-1187]